MISRPKLTITRHEDEEQREAAWIRLSRVPPSSSKVVPWTKSAVQLALRHY